MATVFGLSNGYVMNATPVNTTSPYTTPSGKIFVGCVSSSGTPVITGAKIQLSNEGTGTVGNSWFVSWAAGQGIVSGGTTIVGMLFETGNFNAL